MDPINGDDSKNGLSFANRRKNSVPTGFGLGVNDEVRFIESPTPVQATFNATWTHGSTIVQLAATKSVNLMIGTMVANTAAGVVHTLDTTNFKVTSSQRYRIPATFTGRVAYNSLSSSKDGSGKTRISFWIRNEIALTAGQVQLKVCSDAGANTVVGTFSVPAIPTVNQWVPVVINGSFPANINSWRLDLVTSLGALSYINIDNVNAVEPMANGGVSLAELIGLPSSKGMPGGGSVDTWYAVDAISQDKLYLALGPNDNEDQRMGYGGATTTQKLCVLSPIQMPALAASDTTPFYSIIQSGGDNSYLKASGGWDHNTMNTQSGVTWFDGRNGRGIGLNVDQRQWVQITNFGFARFYRGVQLSRGRMNLLTDISANNNQDVGVRLDGECFGNSTTYNSLQHNSRCGYSEWDDSARNTLSGGRVWANGGDGVEVCHNNFMLGGELKYNRNSAIYVMGAGHFRKINTGNNGEYAVKVASKASAGYHVIMHDCSLPESTVVGGIANFSDVRVSSHHHNNAIDDYRVWTDGGTMQNEKGADRHTLSGFAWKISPLSPRTRTYPILFPLCSLAVLPGTQVTVTGWFKRTTSQIRAKLIAPDNQLTGVVGAISPEVSAIGSYQQLTIHFTPTEQGVIDIYAQVYDDPGASVYVDDMSAVQS
jgi:hypothetical protein